MNQIEARREMIKARFEHSWSKSSTRIPIPMREYKALLDLWEATKDWCDNEDSSKEMHAALEKLKVLG